MDTEEESVVAEDPSSEPTAKNYSLREELTQNRGILRSPCGRFEQSDTGENCCVEMAEREGFEPPIGLHLCRISSAVHSTTLPPLQAPIGGDSLTPRSGRVLGEDGGPDKARGQEFRESLFRSDSIGTGLYLFVLTRFLHANRDPLRLETLWRPPAQKAAKKGQHLSVRANGAAFVPPV